MWRFLGWLIAVTLWMSLLATMWVICSAAQEVRALCVDLRLGVQQMMSSVEGGR